VLWPESAGIVAIPKMIIMAHSTLVVGQRACDPPTHFWLIHNDLFWQITEQDSAYLIDSPCVPHSPDRRALKVGVSGYERHRSADDMYRTDVRSIVHCAPFGGIMQNPHAGTHIASMTWTNLSKHSVMRRSSLSELALKK
jgi:hypothetical protein